MIVLDSSAWIEIGRGSRTGEIFAALGSSEPVAVPTVVVAEVLKHALRNRPDMADDLETQLGRCAMIDLTADLARDAAELSLKHSLSLADAIIYASTLAAGARLATCDAHFKGLPGVLYHPKG
ncbi:MAG: PIN domain-containing protein [Planctomycetes bacterium]|nr:PIN domain-containing protein [Planctomycetota bacterium]